MEDKIIYKSWPGLTYADTIYNTNRSWYHEDIQDKDTLLVAAGDSWTWGDSLFGIDSENNIFDDPRRVTGIYGRKLANLLDADFVNIGICGASNLKFIRKLGTVLSHNIDKYKKIYVVLTLTENGRDLSGASNVWSDNIPIDTLDNFLKTYEKNMFSTIEELLTRFNKCKFLVGRNFTYSYAENIKPWHLEYTWVDILEQAQTQQNQYPKDLRMLSIIAYLPMERFFKNQSKLDIVKDDMIKELDKGKVAIDWLMTSSLNHKKATRHPTLEGHELWANYLYQEFIKQDK